MDSKMLYIKPPTIIPLMMLSLNNETGSIMAFNIQTQSKIVNGNAVKSNGAFFTKIAQKINTKARKPFKLKSRK